ncbi:MAG: nitroreductase family protein [Candidatus Woesearchaeota archaeon]
MNTLDAINARRSIRRYLDRPVEFEKLTTILDAAIKAPSAGNLQDWRFILVVDRELIKQVANYSIEQYWIQTAPALIIVCAVPEKHEMYYGLRGKRLYNIQDCAAAIENILLTATDVGLGSCWIGAFEEEKIRSMFVIPPDVRPQAIITVGYSDEIPKERQLAPIDNVVFFNRYGMKVEKLHIVMRDYSEEWQKQSEKMKHSFRRHFKRVGEEFHRFKDKFRKDKNNEK